MKADGDVEALTFGPQWIVIGMMPWAALDQTRKQENTFEAEFFDATPGFGNRGVYVMGSNHGNANQAFWIGRTEVMHPVVVGPCYRGCEGRVQTAFSRSLSTIESEHGQPFGRELEGNVETLCVHCV